MGSCTDTSRAIRNLLCGAPPALPQIVKPIPLQAYFNQAYKEARSKHKLGDQPADDSTDKLHVPMTLIAYGESGDVHSRAGIYQDEMHFSASLLKAGVMYRKMNATPVEKMALESMTVDNQHDLLKMTFKTDDDRFQALLKSELFASVSH